MNKVNLFIYGVTLFKDAETNNYFGELFCFQKLWSIYRNSFTIIYYIKIENHIFVLYKNHNLNANG